MERAGSCHGRAEAEARARPELGDALKSPRAQATRMERPAQALALAGSTPQNSEAAYRAL